MEMPVGFNKEYDRAALVAAIEQCSLNIARIQSVLNIQVQAKQGLQQQLVLLQRAGTDPDRVAQIRGEITLCDEAVASMHGAIREEAIKQVQNQRYVEYIDWLAVYGDL